VPARPDGSARKRRQPKAIANFRPSPAQHPLPERGLTGLADRPQENSMPPLTETVVATSEHGGLVPQLSANGSGHQLYELLGALQAMRVGDFSVRMSGDRLGIEGKIADTFNEIVAANQRMAQQLERVGQVVGREGKTRQRVRFNIASGAWGE